MDDCIFCKIIAGSIPCSKVYEDERVLAFDDIHPVSPVHVVIVPKEHIPTLLDLRDEKTNLLPPLVHAIQEVARIKGIDQRGFKTVINCNKEGGQVIFHLHVHVVGGGKIRVADL
ncbi:MAG: histidine triad nucleotide-binding protein [Syntrophaceae bacterium]|nr:histidine triad nucleotide-binding protein [Syntrophaceae bacterium]